MLIQISEFVSIYKKYNSLELSIASLTLPADYLVENPTSIKIKNKHMYLSYICLFFL